MNGNDDAGNRHRFVEFTKLLETIEIKSAEIIDLNT